MNYKFIDIVRIVLKWLKLPFMLIGVVAILIALYFEEGSTKTWAARISVGSLIGLLVSAYDTIRERLDSINSSLQNPHPPEFKNFHAVDEPLFNIICDVAKKKKEVKIQVLACAAKYTWPFLEKRISSLTSDTSSRNKFKIEMVLATENVLTHHHQFSWVIYLRSTITSMASFRSKRKSEFASGCIILEEFYFDNLPHWHGVLVDESILFLGRTEWLFNEDKENYPELNIGEVEYRLFSRGDRFGGTKRIERFENWINYYKYRHKFISDSSTQTVI